MILLFCCDEKNIDYVYLSKSDFLELKIERNYAQHIVRWLISIYFVKTVKLK